MVHGVTTGLNLRVEIMQLFHFAHIPRGKKGFDILGTWKSDQEGRANEGCLEGQWEVGWEDSGEYVREW